MLDDILKKIFHVFLIVVMIITLIFAARVAGAEMQLWPPGVAQWPDPGAEEWPDLK
uniref:Unkown protein n=1 Tax=Riptortus pedestris TaxID=329032 RepID=R4WHS5_RIPPE|nr:unkown protein [Riptortus pedestris]